MVFHDRLVRAASPILPAKKIWLFVGDLYVNPFCLAVN